MTSRYSPESFFKIRRQSLLSFALQATMAYLLALPRFPDSDLLFMDNCGYFVFPLNAYKVVSNSDVPAFNMPSQLAHLYGPSMRGELILAMASYAQTFLEHIEQLRMCYEVLIGDHLKDSMNVDSLLEYRDIIDANIVRLAPPSGPGCTPEDSIDWMKAMNELLDRSREPVPEAPPRQEEMFADDSILDYDAYYEM